MLRIVKMTEFDFVRWPNSTAQTSKLTEFARIVNLDWLNLIEIKVHPKIYSPLDLLSRPGSS